MAQKVAKVGVKKQKGYLYFVEKRGDVSCAKMARGNKKGGQAKKVLSRSMRLLFVLVQRTLTRLGVSGNRDRAMYAAKHAGRDLVMADAMSGWDNPAD